ncbi:MAG: META domain-containing protein, partial [Candidatus Acidiferrales bacterium]
VNTPAPEPVQDASATVTYTARTDAHELVLVVRETPCQDVMSGEPFPYTVTVGLDGKELKGCGRTLMTGEILQTYWKLGELGDAPAVEAVAPREPHLRLLAENNSATGSSGCNTFRGSFKLEGERLHLGPLVATRMACLDQSLARQEAEYLRALEASDRATVVDGRLTLYAGTWVLARFDAVYLR